MYVDLRATSLVGGSNNRACQVEWSSCLGNNSSDKKERRDDSSLHFKGWFKDSKREKWKKLKRCEIQDGFQPLYITLVWSPAKKEKKSDIRELRVPDFRENN